MKESFNKLEDMLVDSNLGGDDHDDDDRGEMKNEDSFNIERAARLRLRQEASFPSR
jgi:hypothetical protein